MLKKMRWHFVLSAMAAFGAVVLALLVAVNLWNYSLMAKKQDATLRVLQQYSDSGFVPYGATEFAFSGLPGAPSAEAQYAIRFFAVRLDGSGQITRIAKDYVATVTGPDAENYTKAVLKTGRTAGYFRGYRYLVSRLGSYTDVVFLNSSNELQYIKALLVVSCIVAACSLLALFGLVLAFSSRAVAPYALSVERQKQFVTDAGHEIKTPLTSIATSADVLAMEHSDDEWVENIQKQTKRLTKLVGNLVLLSRFDEESPFPEKTEFSFSDAVWEASEPFTALARARGKQYTRQIQDGLRFTGDQTSIQQMITILLDNAFKYSDDPGNIRLEASQKHRELVLEVYNTCRLPDDLQLDRLFDRFYRGDKSRPSGSGSSGIGLSIARAVTQAHGGRIMAQSQDRQSILFRVTLPVR